MKAADAMKSKKSHLEGCVHVLCQCIAYSPRPNHNIYITSFCSGHIAAFFIPFVARAMDPSRPSLRVSTTPSFCPRHVVAPRCTSWHVVLSWKPDSLKAVAQGMAVHLSDYHSEASGPEIRTAEQQHRLAILMLLVLVSSNTVCRLYSAPEARQH